MNLESFKNELESLSNKIDSLIEKSDKILTVEKVSEMLNLSKNYILKLCRMNAFPYHKIGNKQNYYFLQSELNKFIKQNGIQ
mgnify:CR=1 FL=1